MPTTRLRALLIAGLAITGLSMRTAVTSVGAALDELQVNLQLGGLESGIITTLPVICFALIGALTPRLVARVPAHLLLVLAICAGALGLGARALAGNGLQFALFSVLALSGGAIANVLMPTLVRTHFPNEIGRMTAVYTTTLALGITLAAGLTVPVSHAAGSWRAGQAVWAAVALVAALPWMTTLRHDTVGRPRTRTMLPKDMLRSRTARALMILFAGQSFQAYIAFGWFAKMLHSYGIPESTAGWMLALLSAMSIPLSAIVPNVSPAHQRHTITVLSACYLASYVGLAFAPVGGAWLWMVLNGTGAATFPVALTLIGLRARTPATTAALSAFVQSVGYLVAGTGPLLFGVIHDLSGTWNASLALAGVALALSWFFGQRAARMVYVDDELTGAEPSTAR